MQSFRFQGFKGPWSNCAIYRYRQNYIVKRNLTWKNVSHFQFVILTDGRVYRIFTLNSFKTLKLIAVEVQRFRIGFLRFQQSSIKNLKKTEILTFK